MDRPFLRRRITFVAVLLLAAIPLIGCQSALFTALWVLKGNDVDPDFKELKGKKVAVVCRPLVSLQYSNSNVGRELAKQISLLLQEKVPKIKVIDQGKINKWADEHSWEEFTEVGKAMKAEMVVAVDLESFGLFQGQTLYEGKANATIHVFDMQKGGKEVFHKSIPQARYPASGPMPASEKTPADFRVEFEAVLANQIARHFFAHDRYADIGPTSGNLE